MKAVDRVKRSPFAIGFAEIIDSHIVSLSYADLECATLGEEASF